MRWLVPLLLVGVLLVAGFSELDQYNVTWDAALGELFFGQRYVSYFTTFDAKYLDFDADPYPPGHVPDLRLSTMREQPWEFLPVGFTLAAATSQLLRGSLDPFDGFYAVNLFTGALLLLVFYRWVERVASTAAALTSTLLLFLMPRIVCDLFANLKDFSELVFFAIALLLFQQAYERASFGGILAAGAVWGLALGTKANAFFLPFVVIVYVLWRGTEPWRGRERKLFIALIAAGVVATAVFFVTWPYLWAAPVKRVGNYLQYISGRARGGTAEENLAPWLQMVLITTPPLTLLLMAAAVPLVVRRAARREPVSVFLLSWVLVVVARLSLPGAINFDGVRHFLELFPPLAAMAGMAAVEISAWLVSRWKAIALRHAVAAIAVAASAYATVSSHPFETTYFNFVTGGLSGAYQRGIPQAGDYWGASYRHGIRWLNQHAPRGSQLIVPIAGHTVVLVAPVRLRPDISVRINASIEKARSLPGPVYLMFVLRREWSTELDRDALKRLQPVAEWRRDGAPVLLIYRYK
ncbi:MAG TPA: glycosyltransferase family 39 protein [Thermoanaerobaculia bacterium]